MKQEKEMTAQDFADLLDISERWRELAEAFGQLALGGDGEKVLQNPKMAKIERVANLARDYAKRQKNPDNVLCHLRSSLDSLKTSCRIRREKGSAVYETIKYAEFGEAMECAEMAGRASLYWKMHFEGFFTEEEKMQKLMDTINANTAASGKLKMQWEGTDRKVEVVQATTKRTEGKVEEVQATAEQTAGVLVRCWNWWKGLKDWPGKVDKAERIDYSPMWPTVDRLLKEGGRSVPDVCGDVLQFFGYAATEQQRNSMVAQYSKRQRKQLTNPKR